MNRQRVGIIHAFSRANTGDGLLVDLTFKALQAAGVERDQCVLVALDSDSFSDAPSVIRAPGEPTARPSRRLLSATVEVMKSLTGGGEVRRRLAPLDALVAVGGGYLVADSLVRQAGISVNHLAQLRAAMHHSGPTVYLPQSIGPLEGIAGRLTLKALAGVDRIYARDDTTMRELALSNVCRCPDLAVLELGRKLKQLDRQPMDGAPVLVGRDLPRPGEYPARLKALFAQLPDAVWAVQADTPGPRSDREFYRQQSFGEAQPLARQLEQPGGPVISVRLHGAIGALLAGRPAIHLAYERKGWGAYEDLGLTEFVHDARAFDPALVARQVLALAVDPTGYWNCIGAASATLSKHWSAMVDDLAERLASRQECPAHA